MIKGSVGAGDTFCAGSLYGIYHNLKDEDILKFASAAAACNLFEANSIDGIKSKEEIENMANTWERLKI
jgi:sugar/nucleoside kinase (ribokinase family)